MKTKPSEPETDPSPATLRDAFLAEVAFSRKAARYAVEANLRMSEAARDLELRRVLERYADQARDHASRLDAVADSVDGQETYPALSGDPPMKSVRDSVDALLAVRMESRTLDALMICLAQKAAHLQIAAFGTLCVWAKTLGEDAALEKLKPCLSEAKGIDARLTDVASERVNPKARP